MEENLPAGVESMEAKEPDLSGTGTAISIKSKNIRYLTDDRHVHKERKC